MRTSLGVLLAAAATACNGSNTGVETAATGGTGGVMLSTAGTNGTGSGTQGSNGTGTSGGFGIAGHARLPQVSPQGGPLLSRVDLVTVSYSDAQLDLGGYVDALLGSSWLAQVGTEYGVQAGSHLANYVIPGAGPTIASDLDVQALLAGLIDGGHVPSPMPSTVYAVELPPETTLETPTNSDACSETGGYHSFDSLGQTVYAVLPNCTDAQNASFDFFDATAANEARASREIFEAATDPQGAQAPAYLLPESVPSNVPWVLTYNAELADLCAAAPLVALDAGLFATRVWSNSAADAGMSNPCVPHPANEVYFTVSPELVGTATVASNLAVAAVSQSQPQTFTFNLTGWSTAAIGDWTVFAKLEDATFTPGLSITDPTGSNQSTLNNGVTRVLSVTVPAETGANNFAGIGIYSQAASDGGANVAAVAVYLE